MTDLEQSIVPMTRFTIPPQIIDCIKEGRSPELSEIRAVADHIRSDIMGRHLHGRSDARARRIAVRAAQTALAGCVP